MSTSDLRTILREAKGKELGVVVRVAENILGEYELELRRQMQRSRRAGNASARRPLGGAATA